MATDDFDLALAPTQPHELELWLQHAAGFIVFEDARRYAIDRLNSSLSAEARSAAETAINDTIYGLMQILDGVTGRLQNQSEVVDLQVVVRYRDRTSPDVVKSQVDLADGDGMCIAFHGWMKGDYGECAPMKRRENQH